MSTIRFKYPRTYHFPWSSGTSDDKILDSVEQFEGKQVVVTVKEDGENCTMYKDYIHARSMEYNSHPSRSYVKSLHSKIADNIPEGWRICGENIYAKHSIEYNNLESYFQVFSIWNEKNICLSWNDTVEYVQLLDLVTVPILYIGLWDIELIKKLYQPTFNGDPMEGYVVRLIDSFHYSDFKNCVGKFVRPDHVTSDNHWKYNEVIPNKLKKT
jgi:hypothetical protein